VTPQADVSAEQVRFCRSADGTRIAYAAQGEGPALVISTCWLSHLQFDRQSPVWRHWIEELGSFTHLVRYDERGFGLSDWDVDDFSFEQRVADLEAVIDAVGVEHVALLGMATGGQVAVMYALKHPERVTRLILNSTYPAMAADDEGLAMERAFVELIRVGWARPESEFRRVFTSLMIPGATPEQMTWLDDLQRVATSTENAIRFREARSGVDLTDVLGGLDVPTLVIQGKDERINSFEGSRELASLIPGAQLTALDSANHILLADEPAWPVFVSEVRTFLAPETERFARERTPDAERRAALHTLTPRERDVLRHVAGGQDNEEIAAALSLSTRTVERHLQNAYLKLGVSGRSARAAAVAALLSSS
jgi:pimeloyl-ACP methyl ester carboxylesterase/DNA-binding CsgD family transcriptional regulator